MLAYPELRASTMKQEWHSVGEWAENRYFFFLLLYFVVFYYFILASGVYEVISLITLAHI